MAMRGVPSAGSALLVTADGGGGAASCLLQAANDRLATIAVVTTWALRIGATLGQLFTGCHRIPLRGFPRERRRVVTDGHRRREPRALDAEQIHETWNTVFGRGLDAEIRLRLARTVQFRPNTRVVGHQRTVGERRPIVADRLIEARRAGCVDGVVDLLYPLDVRAEADAPTEIERRVDAEPRGMRHRVDE